MVIYVDEYTHCHTVNDGTMREVETPVFDGKCSTFIEGYCYDDRNGYVSVYPWQDWRELDAAQREYERQLIADMQAALEKLDIISDKNNNGGQ